MAVVDGGCALPCQDENGEVSDQGLGVWSLRSWHAVGGAAMFWNDSFVPFLDIGRAKSCQGSAGTAFENFWIHMKPSGKSTWKSQSRWSSLIINMWPYRVKWNAGWVPRSSLQEWANLVEPISYRSTTPMGEVTVPTTETVCPCLRLGIIAAMKYKTLSHFEQSLCYNSFRFRMCLTVHSKCLMF